MWVAPPLLSLSQAHLFSSRLESVTRLLCILEKRAAAEQEEQQKLEERQLQQAQQAQQEQQERQQERQQQQQQRQEQQHEWQQRQQQQEQRTHLLAAGGEAVDVLGGARGRAAPRQPRHAGAGLTAAIPVENPYCTCELTRGVHA